VGRPKHDEEGLRASPIAQAPEIPGPIPCKVGPNHTRTDTRRWTKPVRNGYAAVPKRRGALLCLPAASASPGEPFTRYGLAGIVGCVSSGLLQVAR
jgi:hypothetical protein